MIYRDSVIQLDLISFKGCENEYFAKAVVREYGAIFGLSCKLRKG